jgi:ABC-type dipeptide/oligopeptide/nickel transport system permease subunit
MVVIERPIVQHAPDVQMPPRVSNLERFIRTKPLGVFGASVVIFMVAIAIVGLFWTPKDPLVNHAGAFYQAPSKEFLLGTNGEAQDLLSRLMVGARYSLYVALVAVSSGIFVGFAIGLTSAYFGGKTDFIVQRFVDLWMATPGIVLVLALVTARPAVNLFPPPFNSPLNDIVIAIALFEVAGTSRIIRSVALSEARREYAEAARAIGASPMRIMWRHIAPQCVPVSLVLFSAALGGAILIEASLSFLGFGVPPPTPTWGNMLARGTVVELENAPWMVVFPGLALTFTVLGFNLLGDAVRDILDPRLRR